MKCMTVSRNRKAWWMVALVGAVMTVIPAAQAQAQTTRPDPAPDPAAVAEACRNEIAMTTRAGVEATFKGARKAIEHIAMLAQEGAPPPVIWRAALESKKRLAAITRRHVERINAITKRCAQALRDLNADPPLIRSVLAARAHGIAHLARAYKVSCKAIVRAARRATGAGDAPPSGGAVLDSADVG